MQRPAYVSVWIYLLTHASVYGNEKFIFNGKSISLKPGQLITGAHKIARITGVPRGTVERIIKTFKNEEQIEVQTNNKYSVITVKKWKEYQIDEKQNEELMRNKRGTNEDNKEDKRDKIEKNISKDIQTSSDYGDKDINSLIKEFETIRGFKSSGGAKDRIMAKHLLNNFTREQLTYMLNFCDKPFAPRVGSICDLWFSRGKILAGIKDLKNTKSKITIIG